MSNATVGSVHTLSKTKIAVAITAAAALIAAPVLLQGSIAHAATVNVGASDVQPVEIGGPLGTEPGYNYDQWHIGSAAAGQETEGASAFDFDDPAGITLHPKSVTTLAADTQLFKGVGNVADLTPMTAAELRDYIEGVSIQASGNAHLQIAGNFVGSGNTWTTLRPVTAHGNIAASAVPLWTGSGGAIGGDTFTLDEFFSNYAGSAPVLYGVGVVVTAEATVASITFGGDLYNFAAAPTPGVVDTAAPAAADYTALITALAIFAGLGLALGAVAVRRKVQA